MGLDRQRDRLAWRQGCHPAATIASPRWRRTGASQLDGDPEGGPSVALGVQPDADRCGDTQVRALGTTTGRRSGRPGKRATTKSSVSRRFVALSTAKLKEWLAADLSGLDLLVIKIDGLHVGDYVLVAAIGIDGAGDKHVLALALGATENAAVVKARSEERRVGKECRSRWS